MKKQRILVVGAGGFLGSHLCDYFCEQQYAVAGVGRSPNRLTKATFHQLGFFHALTLPHPDFADIVAAYQPEVMLYCAGTASVPASFQAPYDDFRRSVEICAFTLETLRTQAPDCAFYFLSSAAIYGNASIVPTHEQVACTPVSPYGFHKQVCELLIQEYVQLYGLQASVLRIFSAYGERLNRQVIHDLCRRFRDASIAKVELFGTGQEGRDFIHASDIARAIECIILSQTPDLYNLGSGQAIAIADLAYLIQTIAGSSKAIEFNQQTRGGDPFTMEADISKLKQTGFTPTVSLHDGVKRYWDWFISADA